MVLLGLSAYGIHRYSIIYLFLKHRRDVVKPDVHFQDLPLVTVQLPVFNEFYVVRRLIESVGRLDYPADRLQIQVLDDSTDETTDIAAAEVEKLRARGLDATLIHRVDREGFKAGALAEGLREARGEFIFILDADFVPPADVIRKCVHHFTDARIGMVQTRWGHMNRNHSLLTRVQAMFLDGHLLLEQTARNRSGRFFNFNGTAGMWRRSCIEDAGGWHHDTLTEDLDLSYRAQLKGWKFRFLPEVIVPAELPVDMNGFKSQQHRWTKGSIQTCLKLLPAVWREPGVPLLVKLEATAHLTSNFGYLLLVLLCILILPQSFAGHAGWVQTLLVDIPIFLATTVSIATFYIVAQRHLNPRDWLRDLLLLPMLLALAIGMSVNNARGVLEALLGRNSEFTRTPKYGHDGGARRQRTVRYLPIRSMLPAVEVLFAIYFAYCTWNAVMEGAWTSVPFLLLFLVGFVYVSAKSIVFWLSQFASVVPAGPVARTEA
ncbi:MAG: glycosyltransferase family 2 protein [Terrimicrobiaceae bacterium]|nr:glycosyltransferase family 2 protein [Terrimicrobiaceae bacterium]